MDVTRGRLGCVYIQMYLGAQSAYTPARLDFDRRPVQHPPWSLGVSGIARRRNWGPVT